MEIKIRARELPFFDYVPKGYASKIAPLFAIKNFDKSSEVLALKSILPGYYIIIEGSVGLFNNEGDEQEEPLETLAKGSSFGEMSLVTKEDSAFKTIALEETTLLFLSSKKFASFLKVNPEFASPFYKKGLEVIGERIHSVNGKIEEETSKLKSEIFNMMKGNRLDERLIETQMTVNKTGAEMFDSLAALMPDLENLSNEAPQHSESFKKIKDEIQKVLLIDSQNFDLISQQIDIIHMYILNVQRFLLEQKLQTIHGDFNITSLASKDTSNSDDDIEFF